MTSFTNEVVVAETMERKMTAIVPDSFVIPAVEYSYFTGAGIVRLATFENGQLYDQIANRKILNVDGVATQCQLSLGYFENESYAAILESRLYPEIKIGSGSFELTLVETLFGGEGTRDNGSYGYLDFSATIENHEAMHMHAGGMIEFGAIRCVGRNINWQSITQALGGKIVVE